MGPVQLTRLLSLVQLTQLLIPVNPVQLTQLLPVSPVRIIVHIQLGLYSHPIVPVYTAMQLHQFTQLFQFICNNLAAPIYPALSDSYSSLSNPPDRCSSLPNCSSLYDFPPVYTTTPVYTVVFIPSSYRQSAAPVYTAIRLPNFPNPSLHDCPSLYSRFHILFAPVCPVTLVSY